MNFGFLLRNIMGSKIDLITRNSSADLSDTLFFQVQAIASYDFFSQNVELHTYSLVSVTHTGKKNKREEENQLGKRTINFLFKCS